MEMTKPATLLLFILLFGLIINATHANAKTNTGKGIKPKKIKILSTETLTPYQTVKIFIRKLKAKKADELLKLLYIPDSEKMPKLTAKMKKRIVFQFTRILGCLLNGETGPVKETADLAVVTAYEELPDNKKSADLKSIYLIKVKGVWKISPLFFNPIPSPNMSNKAFSEQVQILKNWYKNQAKIHSEKLIPTIKITKKQIPYQKQVSLAPGQAVTIVLPDGKTLAVWCKKTGLVALPGDNSDLDLCYGEKPFKDLEIKWIQQSDGSRAAGPYKSYIRSGPVTTWSSGPGHEYVLYVGKTYRVTLREEGDKNGLLPIKLSVRPATSKEKIKPENEVDYLVSQLKQKQPRKRISAIKELQGLLMLGSMYATPRREYIVKQIRPLSKDSDPDVREQASETLRALGDLDSIMEVIAPEPKGKNLNAYAALALGRFTKRSKNVKARQKVYDHVKKFFNSNNPNLRAFAVNFFTYADMSPDVRQQLIKAQKDPSSKVRKASVVAMEQVYPEREIPKHRIPMLEDKSPEVVIAILQYSAGFGAKRELPISAVRKFINSNNKKIRLAAIDTIRFKDNRQSEAILLPLTHDKDKDIRVAATYALCGGKSEKIYKRMLELIHDSDSLVRIRALQCMDLDDYIKAIPHIEKFIKTEKNKNVRRVAKEALNKLTRLRSRQNRK